MLTTVRSTPAFDKIICLGKNYLEHAHELGDAIPDKPVLFIKPPSSAVLCSEQGGSCSVSLPRNRYDSIYVLHYLSR